MKDFLNKKITVMGIGLHGGAIETIKWLLRQGASVIATDIGSKELLDPSLEKLKGMKNLKIVIGQHRPEDFSTAEMIIKNPAVPWTNKYIKIAKEKNIPIETDSSLFFKYCPSEKIIGITGTKGKTTTALLIYNILKTASKKVVKVGISQEPVISKLTEIDEKTYVVFELSSWRLSGLVNCKKNIPVAVITNIYPDHLNYYNSMNDYIQDKKIILDLQKEEDTCVINQDNVETEKLSAFAKGRVIFFSSERIGCDNCIFIKEGGIVYKTNGSEQKIIALKDLKLRGHHNTCNVMAAVGATLALGVENKYIKKTLLEFKGAHHRLEFVREINGVKFYNDSAATTPEAGIAGVNSFLKPIHLICGGSTKNLDLSIFAKKIAESKYVKKIYLLNGKATENLGALIEKNNGVNKIEGEYNDIATAVRSAFEKGEKDEVILLSPACASFGMFKNEFDRGEKFKRAVEQLKN